MKWFLVYLHWLLKRHNVIIDVHYSILYKFSNSFFLEYDYSPHMGNALPPKNHDYYVLAMAYNQNQYCNHRGKLPILHTLELDDLLWFLFFILDNVNPPIWCFPCLILSLLYDLFSYFILQISLHDSSSQFQCILGLVLFSPFLHCYQG